MMIFFVFISVFVFMEFIAWATHKYVMHGFLWFLHEDHHVRPKGFFQKNDAFFLIFALPSWQLIMFGFLYSYTYLIAAGFGIALYGLLYFLVHDLYIHERFFKTSHWKIPILSSIRKAHILHHGHTDKADGEYFGLISSPLKFLIKK